MRWLSAIGHAGGNGGLAFCKTPSRFNTWETKEVCILERYLFLINWIQVSNYPMHKYFPKTSGHKRKPQRLKDKKKKRTKALIQLWSTKKSVQLPWYAKSVAQLQTF